MNPKFTIVMENGEVMEGELYKDKAPNTVANFTSLANSGFYDGLKFHRVIPGFVIQGGCPLGNGTGGPDYSIKGEFKSNGFDNDLKHEAGVLSMARSGHKDSAGSQFFVCLDFVPHLDGGYAAFGKVLKGMETAQKVAAVKRDYNDMPYEDQIMKSVRVEYDGEAPKVEKLKRR